MDFSSSSSSSSFTADNALKILTPFWDVVLRYITNVVVVIAFGTLPIQAAKDTLACVVVVNCPNTTASSAMKQLHGTSTCEILNQVTISTFLNQACYYTLDISESFFVVILCCEAFALLFASNIWSTLYPKSSLTMSYFVSVVSECYDCVGTDEQVEAVITDSTDIAGLDEATKAKIQTTHSKVTRFCKDQSKRRSLFGLYLIQQVTQVVFSFSICLINLIFFRSFQEKFKCSLPEDEFLPIQYNYISCYRYITPFNELVSHIFTGFVILYFLVALVVLVVIVCKMNSYANSWSKKGDLDFLRLLLKQYSLNQYDRFETFRDPKKTDISSKGESRPGDEEVLVPPSYPL